MGRRIAWLSSGCRPGRTLVVTDPTLWNSAAGWTQRAEEGLAQRRTGKARRVVETHADSDTSTSPRKGDTAQARRRTAFDAC